MAILKRSSLADEVAAAIQHQVKAGKYQIGEKLPIEPELMKNFGVGRSTIREAIKLLTNSGLLRVQQGLGTFVEDTSGIREPLAQRFKRASAQNLDEVRQLLEMKIAEKAAVNRTDDDIAQIKAMFIRRTEAARAGLMADCVEADVSFHTAIAEASGNDILADLYKSVATHLKSWFMESYPDTQIFVSTTHLHEQLMNSIIEGDAKKAWNCAARIIGHVSQ
ncbi:GntR family transcriptional regulator [Mucilaginibacter gynuensis]|uniref:GntR family transcriptional regulator n=1 Tax=Mucilaginibacter gynuensis TaxID=1302236 RepID=A0ABP8G382_9SPHI